MDDKKTEKVGGPRQTLTNDDIVRKDEKPVERRSALRAIGAGILGAVSLAVGTPPPAAEAQNCTDSDGGPYSDPGGYGRRCRVYYRPPVVVVRRGCTDSDGGPYSDAAGYGRHCGAYVVPARVSCTDSDAGSYADPGGGGRYCRY